MGKMAILSVFAYFVLLRKFFITICPAVLINRTSVSGLWHDESIYTSFASGFCGSLADAPICISFYDFYSVVRNTKIYIGNF